MDAENQTSQQPENQTEAVAYNAEVQAKAPATTVTEPKPQSNASAAGVSKETLWYLDNYILLRDYYDRTISRIAARCVRMGNIAMEEYPHYNYILDVLQEISETGNFVLSHKELYPYDIDVRFLVDRYGTEILK